MEKRVAGAMCDRLLAEFLEPDGPSLSYTQWEAWLALWHGKKLFIATPSDGAPRDEKYRYEPDQQNLQRSHLVRLRGVARYPVLEAFTGDDNLAAEVLRSFVLDLLVAAGLTHRPQTLPFASIGPLFKGRSALMEALETADRPLALIGAGGVGKTRLAIEHAWRQIGRCNAVLLVSAGSAEALNRNLAALCKGSALDLPEKELTEEAAQRQAVLHWLQANPGWLLILDNVDTTEAAAEVEALLPQLSGGQVVITTRLRNWSAAVQLQEVEVLTPEDATAFLLERTAERRRQAPGDNDTAEAIAVEDLGGLALGLEQAGAYISQRRLSLSDYRSLWQRNREMVLSWNDPRLMQYDRSLATTWFTSYQQVSESARCLLRRLAWLSPEPIPESLLAVEVAGDPQKSGDGGDAISQLEGYSLVNRSAEAPIFTVHRLVQEVGRLWQQQPDKPEEYELENALGWLNAAFMGDSWDVRSWPVLDPLAPHVNAVTGFADQAGYREPTARLINALGVLLLCKAAYSDAEPLMRRALAINEANCGDDHPNLAIALNNLAQLLQATNRVAQAEPLLKRALAISEATYGPDHHEVATILNNLALLLKATNRLSEAEPLMWRVVEIFETSYGGVHPSVSKSLNNLARLLQATDRLAEAEPLLKRALAFIEATYGPDHPEVANSLINQASLMYSTNRLAEAEPLMRRALAIDEASYGSEHPKVASDLNNLASLLKATNRLAEAEPLMRRALAIDEASYGSDHTDVARDLNNLASLLFVTNRLAEAEPLMRRVVEIFEISYGTDHPSVAKALNNLAQMLKATNRIAEAEPLMRRVLAIDEASYGSDHTDVARDLNNLAGLLFAINRLVEAEPLMRRVLAIDEASYGTNHPEVATDLNNLAQLLQATNRLAEAEHLMRRSLEIYNAFSQQGYQHPNLEAQFSNYHLLLKEMNLPKPEIEAKLKSLLPQLS